MSSNDVAISVRDLSKSYTIVHGQQRRPTFRDLVMDRLRNPFKRDQKETFWALKDVSFDIKKGDAVGIIGRNGAGKSTLLKILSRITEPTTGEIDLYGRIGSLLEVGTGFHPELTGRENIFLNGAILGMSRAEIRRQFDAIVDFAEVEKFLDTPVKRYSSGMYVRLAFAVAAHLSSEILIVDEVLAVGDAEFQKKCLGKMQSVATQEGRTVLFVSHQMAAVERLCNLSILLREGKVADFGPTAKVIPSYMSDASSSSDGHFSLMSHPARPKRFTVPVVQRLIVSDGTGQRPTTIMRSTGGLSVDVFVVPNRRIAEPIVAIAIEDSFGRRLGTVASNFQRERPAAAVLPFTARCEIPRLNLAPGRYLLSVSVSDRYEGLIDSIDGAAWIDVEWDNAYPSGEQYTPVYGPIILEGSWQLNVDSVETEVSAAAG